MTKPVQTIGKICEYMQNDELLKDFTSSELIKIQSYILGAYQCGINDSINFLKEPINKFHNR